MNKKEQFIETVLKLEDIPQSPKWHPEGNTLEHVKFIIYGLYVKKHYGLISQEEYNFLVWVALFHDLGKIDTLTFDDNGNPHAYGHEYKAIEYINSFEEILPETIDTERLNKFCVSHMKAHHMVKQEMRVTKKEAFKKSFSTEREFYLMMVFESCDSAHSLYEFLRREQRFVNFCYLEPIEFYDKIRKEVSELFYRDFKMWLGIKLKVSNFNVHKQI